MNKSTSGLNLKAFTALKSKEKREYLKAHPHSKYWHKLDAKAKKISVVKETIKQNHSSVDSNYKDEDIEKASSEFAANNEKSFDETEKTVGMSTIDWNIVTGKTEIADENIDEELSIKDVEAKRLAKKSLYIGIAKGVLLAGCILLAGPLLPIIGAVAEDFSKDKEKNEVDDTKLSFNAWAKRKYPENYTELIADRNSSSDRKEYWKELYDSYKDGEDPLPPVTKKNIIADTASSFIKWVRDRKVDNLVAKQENIKRLN
jgi:hypothetical protein